MDFDRGYFGRFDLIVEIVTFGFEGYFLLDLKASRKEKEIAHLRDPIIQVVAYFEIWEVLVRRFPDQVPSLVGVAIACAYGSGSGDLLILSKEEDLQPYRKEWEHWLDTFFELLGSNFAA